MGKWLIMFWKMIKERIILERKIKHLKRIVFLLERKNCPAYDGDCDTCWYRERAIELKKLLSIYYDKEKR